MKAIENIMTLKTAAVAVIAAIMLICTVYAGDLNPSAPPGSTMKTLRQIEPRSAISAAVLPLTITQSGSFYLIEDVNYTGAATAITIEADDVSIDLNGFCLRGPGKDAGTTAGGIYASSQNNIAVTNGTVSDFPRRGIYLGGNNHQITELMACDNGFDGIETENATIIDCQTRGNDECGIEAEYSVIVNCIASENGEEGFSVEYSTVTGCFSSSNSSYGIRSWQGCSLTDCYLTSNSYGIYVAYYNTITGCTARYNTYGGFYTSSLCAISGCQSINNGLDGIYAAVGCRVRANSLRENGRYGLNLASSSNYAVRNTAADNTSGDFQDGDPGSNHMPITGDNANYGF